MVPAATSLNINEAGSKETDRQAHKTTSVTILYNTLRVNSYTIAIAVNDVHPQQCFTGVRVHVDIIYVHAHINVVLVVCKEGCKKKIVIELATLGLGVRGSLGQEVGSTTNICMKLDLSTIFSRNTLLETNARMHARMHHFIGYLSWLRIMPILVLSHVEY